MYLAELQIAFYVALVIGAAVAANKKFQASWRLFFLGAFVIVVASLPGGAIGGLIRHELGNPNTPNTLLIPGLIAGAFEEIARAAVLWRRRHRDGIGDAVMFGIGFGGAEVIERAGRLLLFVIGVAPTGVFGLNSTILCVEIFIFHVCMTLIVYRVFHNPHSSWFRIAAVAAILYHVGLNFCAGGAAARWGLIYTVIVWSILTPLHIAVALRGVRSSRVTPISASIAPRM